MKKLTVNLFFIFCLLSFGFLAVPGLMAETEDITETEPVVEAEAVFASSTLVISLAEDNPNIGTLYNSGDKYKLFLSFELFASSSEDIYIDRLGISVKDSISSHFLNPGHEKNIGNIRVVDAGSGEELGQEIPTGTDGQEFTFVNVDITVPQREIKKIHVYADIEGGIEQEVASKISLINADKMNATGVESDFTIEVSGSAGGYYIKLGAAEPKPDLIVSEISINQGVSWNNFIVDGLTHITVIYRNTGSGPAPVDFAKSLDFGQADGIFEFMNDGSPIESGEQYALTPDIISPTESYTEVYEGVFRQAGLFDLKVEVDPENLIDEINDKNNKFTEEVAIDTDVTYPDFIVYDIVVDPPAPLINEDVAIHVIYKNIGSDFGRDRSDFLTKAYFGYIEGWFIFDEQSPMEISRPHPSKDYPLKSGETFMETYRGYFRKAKEMTLEAAVDPPNRVEESNEDNNKLEKKIVVRSRDDGSSSGGLASKLKGKIVLKVEQNGEAYYINPKDEKAYFLGRPADAFRIMREQGIGITNTNLNLIPIGICRDAKFCVSTDTDNDGLSDYLEDTIGTDKNKDDTDGDRLSDLEEINRGSDPVAGQDTKIITSAVFTEKQKGRILLQVEQNGEAWYVSPVDGRRYFLGRPADAFAVMRNLGLGISDGDFDRL